MGVINSRLEPVELGSKRIEDSLSKHHANFDPNWTVIMFNVAIFQDESSWTLNDYVEHVIADGLQILGVEVVAVKRQPVHDGDNGGRADRPSGVMVKLVSVAMKVEVLRQKRSLNSRRAYKHILIKSAKSHAERLTENNFATLLDELQLNSASQFMGVCTSCLIRSTMRRLVLMWSTIAVMRGNRTEPAVEATDGVVFIMEASNVGVVAGEHVVAFATVKTSPDAMARLMLAIMLWTAWIYLTGMSKGGLIVTVI